MKTLRLLFAALFVLAVPFGIVGCEEKGPMEEAGERMDEALDDMGDGIEDAGDTIEDAVEN